MQKNRKQTHIVFVYIYICLNRLACILQLDVLQFAKASLGFIR